MDEMEKSTWDEYDVEGYWDNERTDALRVRIGWRKSRQHVKLQGFFDDDKESNWRALTLPVTDIGGPPFSNGEGVNNAERGGEKNGWGDEWRQ